jgi:predicted AAA+ superfamily ATPase
MFKRSIALPADPEGSFFLWGARQTGKSTLLRQHYPQAYWIDLLRTDDFVRYLQRPAVLREEARPLSPSRLVVIDEVQKVPALLDEVHWLIENQHRVFALCGSSARKTRRGHANLLGGRAIRYELFGLVSHELGSEFDLLRILNHGYLPRHYLSQSPQKLLRAYVNDYLKEEVAAEGLVRNLPSFSTFLDIAALSDTELINYSTIARDCGISSPSVKEYFQILVDTLLGRYLPAYTARPKRRVVQSPKFYFGDVGVVNFLAKRGRMQPGSELLGKAFENWVYHELRSYGEYMERFYDLSFWRLSSGIEVDFIVNDLELAVEAKATPQVHADHLKGLRALLQDKPRTRRRIVVSLDPRTRRTEDGIDILPAEEFCRLLWAGELV